LLNFRAICPYLLIGSLPKVLYLSLSEKRGPLQPFRHWDFSTHRFRKAKGTATGLGTPRFGFNVGPQTIGSSPTSSTNVHGMLSGSNSLDLPVSSTQEPAKSLMAFTPCVPIVGGI
jgi:hypothetical protein